MTLGKTARRMAALALTIGAVWLCGVSASADVDVSAVEEPEAVIKEALDKNYRGKTVILHSNNVMGAVEGYPPPFVRNRISALMPTCDN